MIDPELVRQFERERDEEHQRLVKARGRVFISKWNPRRTLEIDERKRQETLDALRKWMQEWWKQKGYDAEIRTEDDGQLSVWI